MIQWFKGFIVLAFIVSFLGASADPKDTDIWPWPWGSECPFPWAKIEGDWKIKDKPGAGYFRFLVKSELENGSHIVEIAHLNESFEIMAIGSGLAPFGQKIVRAALHTIGNGKAEGYWVIARAYETNKSTGCNGGIRTVVTIRPIDGQGAWDLTYEIEKVMFGSSGL